VAFFWFEADIRCGRSGRRYRLLRGACPGRKRELFYLIVAGSAAVSVRGEPRPPLAPGDCFGEIALLRGVPRTATVVADQALRTLALDREAFLVAITGNSLSSAAADSLVTQRLAADSPADPDAHGTR
jgi:CRP-like cAMP-binding protein